MEFDYDKAAERYDAYRKGGGPFLKTLHELACRSNAAHVLELGAGTGNNTQAFLDIYPCTLYGLELSRAMVKRAAGKIHAAHWVQGRAEHLPFRSASFDFVFAVLVLHHILDIFPVMQECRRVLRRGCAAFVTSPHDFIDRHPMNRYFPSFAAIDKARFHPIEKIEEALKQAGFSEVAAERIVGEPQPLDRRYLEKVKGRYLSTFDLLPPGELEQGIAHLQADIDKYGVLPIDVRWECVTVWGFC